MSNKSSSPSSVTNLPLFRGWISQLLDIKKFFSTRKAVFSHEPLWNYTLAELDAKGYQAAWTFNLQETALAALPGILALRILNFLFPLEKNILSNPPELSHFAQYFQETNTEVVQTIISFLPPLFLMIIAYLAAWSSLRKADRTKQNIERNLAAYLFLDGALGLWPQMSLSFAITLVAWLNQHEKGNTFTTIILLILGLYGFFYSSSLISNRIPKLLFSLQGYSTERPDFLSWYLSQKIENAGPWRTWVFTQGCGSWILLALLWSTLLVISFVITLALALLKLWIVG